MASSINVELARTVDRDRLLEVLAEHGTPGQIVEDGERVGIEIPCDDEDAERGCEDVLHRVETCLEEIGLPLVPMRVEGGLFLRPPGD